MSAHLKTTGILSLGLALILSSTTALAYPGAALKAPAADSRINLIAEAEAEPAADAAGSKRAVGARKFIDSMAQKGLNFLADEARSQDAKTSEFRRLLQDSYDLETIGRFALGRYWNEATPAQRKEYQKLFRDMVVNVYSARFQEYKGQTFETRSARAEGEKDAIVTSYILQAAEPEVQVDWRVRYKEGQYKVVDVIVEGVSMSVTQRSDFASVIQRGGGNVQVLIDYLKTK